MNKLEIFFFTCSVWLDLIDDAWMADSGIEKATTGHKITNVAAILLKTFCIPHFRLILKHNKIIFFTDGICKNKYVNKKIK